MIKQLGKYCIIPVAAITAIALLEYSAIKAGIDGLALSLAVGCIGAIATGGVIKLKDAINGRTRN